MEFYESAEGKTRDIAFTWSAKTLIPIQYALSEITWADIQTATTFRFRNDSISHFLPYTHSSSKHFKMTKRTKSESPTLSGSLSISILIVIQRSVWPVNMVHVMVPPSENKSRRWKSHSMPDMSAPSAERTLSRDTLLVSGTARVAERLLLEVPGLFRKLQRDGNVPDHEV